MREGQVPTAALGSLRGAQEPFCPPLAGRVYPAPEPWCVRGAATACDDAAMDRVRNASTAAHATDAARSMVYSSCQSSLRPYRRAREESIRRKEDSPATKAYSRLGGNGL